MKKLIALALMISTSFADAAPVTISLTGAELLTYPDASFPTSAPTQNGNSIVFGPGNIDSAFEKLLVFPLTGPTGLTTAAVTEISLIIDLTRLPCDEGGFSCNPSFLDHDPTILIGDGTSLVGVLIANNNNGAARVTEFDDSGTFGSNRVVSDYLFQNAGYPPVGGSFEVTVQYLLTATETTVNLDLLAGSGGTTASALIDPTGQLDFVFMRDDNVSEQYQINAVTINITPVPVPAAAWLFGSALLGLGMVKRRNAV